MVYLYWYAYHPVNTTAVPVHYKNIYHVLVATKVPQQTCGHIFIGLYVQKHKEASNTLVKLIVNLLLCVYVNNNFIETYDIHIYTLSKHCIHHTTDPIPGIIRGMWSICRCIWSRTPHRWHIEWATKCVGRLFVWLFSVIVWSVCRMWLYTHQKWLW